MRQGFGSVLRCLLYDPDRVKSRHEAAGPVSSAKWKHDDVMPAATQDLGSVSLVRRGDPFGL